MAIFQQGSFVLDPNETPQTIAKKRALVQSLMMNYGSADNIGEGIGQLFNGIGVGMANRKADKAEKAGMASGAAARSAIMSSLLGGSQAPKLSGPYPDAPAAPSGQTASAPINATGVDVAKRLQADFGLSPAAAAGFAGNLAHESGNFKTLQEINPTVKGSRGGFGWAQWTGPRRRQYEAWAAENRLDPTSPEANYGFLKHELTNTPEGAVIKALQGVNDPAQAAQIVSDKFLRPGIPHMGSRVSKSQQIANMLMGKGNDVQVASLDPSVGMSQAYAPSPQPEPSTQAVNAMAQGAQQPVPAPQPVQIAQSAPQAPQQPAMAIQDAGTPFERMVPQGGGMDMNMLIQQAQNPWLDDQSRSFVNGLIQHEMQKRDPAYQQQQQMQQLEMQKAQLELQQMQNPQPKWDVVNGKDGSILRVNPQTGENEVIYGPQADPVKPTADIQEYEYAVNQAKAAGIPQAQIPSFDQWTIQQKKAGASQVNIDQKAEGAFDKKLAEGQAESLNTMATEGMNAKADLAVIGELGTLMQGRGGTLDGLSGTLAKYGIGGEGISDIQAAQALINKLVPTQRQAGSGSMSDRDVELFTRSLPSLWNTPGGNQRILSVMEGLAQYKQAQGEIAQRVIIGELSRQDATKMLRAIPNPLEGFGKAAQSAPAQATPAMPDLSKMSDAELEALINGQ